MSGPPPPGQQPSPQHMAAMQAQIAAEAQRRGMTPQQLQAQQRREVEEAAKAAGMTFEAYLNKLRQQAFENHQRQVAAQQQQAAVQAGQAGGGQQAQVQGAQGQQVPIQPGTPDPRALALASFLQSQDLKSRTCILNGQRKNMFRGLSLAPPLIPLSPIKTKSPHAVKRALRAIDSPAYTKARTKSPLLPELTPSMPRNEIFKLLPLSLLALRVSKSDPHAGHDHAPQAKPQKRVKGLWTVKIEQQQDISDDLHYVWLYDGPQWRMKLYAAGALCLILVVVMFPLWPIKLRIGVWYLSMGFLGLIGLFFAMAIFRLILFCVTIVVTPPGLWLYPNLFEDVGFFDSFRPVWGWQEVSASMTLPLVLSFDAKGLRLIVCGAAGEEEEGEEE